MTYYCDPFRLLLRSCLKAQSKKGSYEARTEGCLEDVKTQEKVYALVEVKPTTRRNNLFRIAMQAAAQIAA
jgi:hypothetical protein